jgi:hypothetical protein
MTNNELPALGVTFYCPTDEIFKKVAKLRDALEENNVPTMWSTHDYEGRKVTALDVFAHGNVVAGYLGALDS